MKNYFKSFTFFFFFLLCLNCFPKQVTIFHTNDLHSYFKGTYQFVNNGPERVGGYDKLVSVLKTRKEVKNQENSFILTTDSGDFYSGTLFHALAMRADIPLFPEYAFFSANGYDAITLGNHEFDGKDDGFNLLMRKVQMLGKKVPIVSTNFLAKGIPDNPIVKSLLKEVKNAEGKSIKVGFLGALGPDGCDVSLGNRNRLSFVGYDDKNRKEKWSELVNLLSQESLRLKKKGAELIILLLHGGGEEDERLAKKVPHLDVILAGHTHEKYFKKVNDVLISQAGSYGRFLGELSFEIGESGLIKESVMARHHQIDDSIKEDPVTVEDISRYQQVLRKILEGKGIFIDDGESEVIFSENYFRGKRPSLGKLVTSKVYNGLVKEVENLGFYFTANGLIRNPILKDVVYGPFELFNILPIGFHNGFELGLKVNSFYLSKKEITHLIDFLELYGLFKSKAIPAFSNSLSYEKRSWGIPFVNRIHSVKINGKEVEGLVRVATNTFIYSYLDLITKKTLGVIKLIPKNSRGEQLEKPFVHGVEVEYFLKESFTKTDNQSH